MQKYIIGFLSVVLISTLVIGGTGTFGNFSDSETSSGNKATAWISAEHDATDEKDFETGEDYFVDTTSSPGDVKLALTNYLFACAGGGASNAVYRYDEISLAWESIASVPNGSPTTYVGSGGGLTYPGIDNSNYYMYCMKGNSTTEFYRYNMSTNSWDTRAVVPATVTTGGYLRSGPGNGSGGYYLYAFVGGNKAMYRYDTTANVWTLMVPTIALPANIGAGASMTWDRSGYLYATTGGNTNNFVRYTISGTTGTWTAMSSTNLGNIGAGAELSYALVGSTINIYATQGNSATGFYQYLPSSNTWTVMAVTPAAVTTGGSLRWDDGGFLFAFQGGSSTFWRYNIALNTWAVIIAAASQAVVAGGAYTADTSQYNYAFTGGASNLFLRYDTSVGGDTWSTLVSPGLTGAGAALAYCTSVTPSGKSLGDYIFAFPGSLGSAFWVYSVTGGTWTTTLASGGVAEGDGASLEWTGGDYIYAIFGNATKNFKRYTISTNTWSNMANANTNSNFGACLAWDYSDYIYMINGAANTFERYSISGNTWTNRGNLPGSVNSGSSLVYPYNSYSASNPLYAARGNNSVTFYKYTVSSNTWSLMSNVPSAVFRGGSLCSKATQGYVYCLSGNTTTNHWRYNVTFNTWAVTLPAVGSPAVPGGVSTGAGARMGAHFTGYISSGYITSEVIDNSGICEGGTLAYDGTRYIYSTAGDLSTSFKRYDISTNSWSALKSVDYLTGWGTSLCSDKTAYIYALMGENTNYFLRYSVASNTWTAMADAPGNINAGGALVYAGGNVYAFQGGTNIFWKYTVATNIWSAMVTASASTAAGASLVYDGSTYVYATIGGGTGFSRYSIAGNTWTNMTPRADAVGAGGGVAYPGSGNIIYCTEGNDTSDLYAYSISGNSWSQLGSAPASIFQGGCLVAGDSGYLYTCRGRDTVSFWQYFISGDSWASKADTPAALLVRLDALVWDRTLPAGTTISYYIRGSNTLFAFTDASPSWTLLTVADVNSGASSAILYGLTSTRYVQLKTVFSTTNVTVTPVLAMRTLYFYRWF